MLFKQKSILLQVTYPLQILGTSQVLLQLLVPLALLENEQAQNLQKKVEKESKRNEAT